MDDERNDGDEQEQVNEPSCDMEDDKATDPQNDKQYGDGKKWTKSHKYPH